jgi:hypothetical protein
MAEDRNLFHLRCAAMVARNCTEDQHKWLASREDLHSSETLIGLERKFFLPRKQALKIIEEYANA